MSNDIGKAVEVLQKMLQDDDARENLQSIVEQVVGEEKDETTDDDISLPAVDFRNTHRQLRRVISLNNLHM